MQPVPTTETAAELSDCQGNHISDDKKAQYVNWICSTIACILCAIYFVYQITLFSNPNYNKETSMSINHISTVLVPYLYARIDASFVFWNEDHGIRDLNATYFFIDSSNWEYQWHCSYVFDQSSFVYDESVEVCVVLYLNYNGRQWSNYTQILVLPPFGSRLKSQYNEYNSIQNAEKVKIVLHTTDVARDSVASATEYTSQLSGTDIVEWFADFPPNDEQYSIAKLYQKYSLTSNYLHIASDNKLYINVLEVDTFGAVETLYSYDVSLYPSVSSNVEKVSSDWHSNTSIIFTPNAAGTKTTLTTTAKMTFWDVVAKTGGIGSIVFQVCLVSAAFLISGRVIGKWKINGIAPNTTLSDEEKRKIKTYLKDLGVVD